MQIQFYGTRGSTAVGSIYYDTFGGSSMCARIKKGARTPLIVDLGTGASNLGNDLMKEGQKDLNVLLTHLHYDHIRGIFLFNPFFDESVRVNFFGELRKEERPIGKGKYIGAEDFFREVVASPGWPVYFDKRDAPEEAPYMKAQRQFLNVVPPAEVEKLKQETEKEIFGEIKVEEFLVTPFRLDHPNGALGYRILDKEAGVSCAVVWDNEFKPNAIDSNVLEGIRDCDLVIFDGQYSSRELTSNQIRDLSGVPDRLWGHIKDRDDSKVSAYEKYKGYGHSTPDDAARHALAANVCNVLITSHHYTHNDIVLWAMLADVKQRFPNLNIEFASEGLIANIGRKQVRYEKKPTLEDTLRVLAAKHKIKIN